MLDVEGQTVAVQDRSFKRRRDHHIRHEPTRIAMRERIERRLLPEIWKAFQFSATRIERYIVACYDAAEGGHFMAHRDNTLGGTAHRRFAVTINLNDDYEGGDLRFPEFGPQRYRGPVGGANGVFLLVVARGYTNDPRRALRHLAVSLQQSHARRLKFTYFGSKATTLALVA